VNFRIGILNAETGKVITERQATEEDALKVAERVSKWFDRRDTFFSGKPVWEHWKYFPGLEKFERLIEGSRWSDVVTETVAVFEGNKGTEYEFYIKRE
jgi:hypothetical protein